MTVLKNKNYLPLFLTQFLGSFNDNLFKNALFLYIVFKSYSLGSFNSENTIAIAGALFILPYFLFSAIGGYLADKFRKDKMILYIKIWEVLVMIMAVIGFYYDSVNILVFTLCLMGTQSAFFGPVKYGVLPELVQRDDLLEANAYVEMGTFTAILLGTVFGGFLISRGLHGKSMVCFSVIIVSLLGVFASSRLPKLKRNQTYEKKSLLKIHTDLIDICVHNKIVFLSILAISVFWYLGASILYLFPIYVKSSLHSTSDVATLFLTIFSLGVGTGNIVSEKVCHKFRQMKVLKWSCVSLSLFLFDLFLVGEPFVKVENDLFTLNQLLTNFSFWRICFDLFFMAFSGGIFIVPLYTGLQTLSAEGVTSSVIAGNNIINAFFMVISSLFLMLFYQYGLGKHVIYLILGLINVLVCGVLYYSNKSQFDKYY